MRDTLTGLTATAQPARHTVATFAIDLEEHRDAVHDQSSTASAIPGPDATDIAPRVPRAGEPRGRPDLEAKQSAHWVPAGEAGGSAARQYRQH